MEEYINKKELLEQIKVLREKEMYNSFQYQTIVEVIDIIESIPVKVGTMDDTHNNR